MSEVDFALLKRQRAAAIESSIAEMCDKQGWDPNPSACYCDCAGGGPCEHQWDGPWRDFDPATEGYGGTTTCSKCGASAVSHDLWRGL
jgi:hypothetical protein